LPVLESAPDKYGGSYLQCICRCLMGRAASIVSAAKLGIGVFWAQSPDGCRLSSAKAVSPDSCVRASTNAIAAQYPPTRFTMSHTASSVQSSISRRSSGNGVVASFILLPVVNASRLHGTRAAFGLPDLGRSSFQFSSSPRGRSNVQVAIDCCREGQNA
jgi:hypothetical protein